jgi:hypothetical protein
LACGDKEVPVRVACYNCVSVADSSCLGFSRWKRSLRLCGEGECLALLFVFGDIPSSSPLLLVSASLDVVRGTSLLGRIRLQGLPSVMRLMAEEQGFGDLPLLGEGSTRHPASVLFF